MVEAPMPMPMPAPVPAPEREGYTLMERGIQAAALGAAAFRIGYGFKMHRKIIDKPPEERTWKDFCKAAVVAISDSEGKVLRPLDLVSSLGGVADEIADKFFSNPVFLALKKTQEIPGEHADLQLARDVLVTGARLTDWYLHRNTPKDKKEATPSATAVSSTAQAKTTLQMLTEAAALSPLAQHEDLLRRGAALSTGLSLTTGADYLFKLTTRLRKERHRDQDYTPDELADGSADEPATTQNSGFRELFGGRIDKLVTWLAEDHPEIEADHLTETGKWMVIAAGALAAKYPDKPLLPTILFTIGSLLDTLDGALERKKREMDGGEPTIEGMLKDVLADRAQEIVILSTLSWIARRRGNDVAADSYALAALAATLPAFLRAEAEKQGIIVAEASFGSRVWRAIFEGAGILFNGNQEASDTLSGALATNTTITARDRYTVTKKKGTKSSAFKATHDDPALKEAATARHDALRPVAARDIKIGAALLLGRKILARPALRPAATRFRQSSPAQTR